MQKHRFKLLVLVTVTALLAFTGSVVPLQAGEVEVGVTQAMEEVINAIDPGDQLPDTYGQLSSRWVNEAFGDTSFAAADAQIELEVDTGWDMSDISDTTDTDPGNPDIFADTTATISAGDSVVRAIPIANLGNNYVEIDFSSHHLIEATEAVSNDTFTLSLHHADGFHESEDFDGAATTEVGGSKGDIAGWTMGQVRTLFLVVEADPDAADGNEVESEFFVTNNAPKKTGTGDGWERGTPTGGVDDQYDTQTGVFLTSVAGPIIEIDKQFAGGEPPEDKRPGATVEYELTVENVGSAVAKEVIVVDAIPQFTTYTGDADGPAEATIEYEDTLGGDNWQDPGEVEDEDVQMIRWSWDELADEDPEQELSFSVTID